MNCLCLLCLMCLCGNQGSNGCGTAANTSAAPCGSTLENTTNGYNSCGDTPEPYASRSACDEPRPEYRGNRGPRPIYAGPSAQDGGCGCN
jgi:hypothetical protein